MKRILAAAAVISLAACAEQEAEEVAVEEEAVAEDAGAMAAVGGPGTYEVTYSDGSVGTMVAAEDNTFTFTLGEETGTGSIAEVDGKTCFDTDGDEEGAVCWTNGEVAADGSWTSTSDEGEVVTVTRVEA